MKERPILFSAPMVRAILEGRKSMTRRIVKPQPQNIAGLYFERFPSGNYVGYMPPGEPAGIPQIGPCPYGIPGDRLWVKETWSLPSVFDALKPSDPSLGPRAKASVRYLADGRKSGKTRVSIHMPRWASRILLEITNVRIERLQKISEDDAKAEGLSCLSKDGGRTYKYGIPDRDGLPGTDDDGWHWADWEQDARRAFFKLWDNIHGDENGSGSNPWVWVVEFKRIKT